MTILCRNCGDKDCRHTNSAHLGQLSCFKKKQQNPQTEQAEVSSLSDLLCCQDSLDIIRDVFMDGWNEGYDSANSGGTNVYKWQQWLAEQKAT